MKLTNTLKPQLFLLVILSMFSFSAFAQKGEIRGVVFDEATRTPLDFLPVYAQQDSVNKGFQNTDEDGSFVIKPLEAGTYDLVIRKVGYNKYKRTGIFVGGSDARILDTIFLSKNTVLKTVVIKDIKPIIDAGKTSTGKAMSAEDIKKAPVRDINSLVAAGTGAYQKDNGGIQIGGARANGTRIIVDGQPLRAGANIPTGSIASAEIMTGGLPAKYSDAVGGVISVTTKGGAKKFSGNGELITSQFLDAYGHYLAALGLTGPLLFRKEEGSKNRKPLLGYNINIEFQHDKDPNPSAVGVWKVKDDVLADLETKPFVRNPNTGLNFINRADFVTKESMEQIKAKQNVAQNLIRVASKVDFNLNSNFSLAVGGNFYYNKRHDYIREYSLFNAQNNPEVIDQSLRVFAKFTHHIGNKSDSASQRKAQNATIQNAYYTVQVDFSRDNFTRWDDSHKKNAFNYGYVGKFDRLMAPSYTQGKVKYVTSNGDTIDATAYLQNLAADTLVKFTPSDINKTMANYATNYFSEVGDSRSNFFNSSFTAINLASGGAFLNGRRPGDVNGLWYNTGRQYPSLQYNQKDQYRVNVEGSLDLKPNKDAKPHAIEFGLVFEQRVDRSYGLSAVELWNLMRLNANRQINSVDKDNPTFVYDKNGIFQDTVRYNPKYIASDQTNFDKNLRASLGLAENGLDFINTDALSPDQLKVSMFSPDELFQNGNLYVNYNGYDYTGKIYRGNPSYNDFFTKFDDKNGDGKKQSNENFLRNIGANRPIYSAAYIQDNFRIKDIHFNVGVRVDRFDANTQVLKDPYNLYATYTLDDLKSGSGASALASQTKPTNIAGTSVVYVDDKSNPSKIVGYRNGDIWYDASGVEIKDPNVLAKQTKTGNIAPYRLNPTIQITDSTFDPKSTFKDYTPQTVIQPRLNFSFPINNDQALFYAHYDVYAQRPQDRNYITPEYYLYLDKVATGSTLANPNLKPERQISYEIGFQQKLNRTTGLKISSFYKEFKDLIQVVKVLYADPITYSTYGNKDFSTTKGFEVQLNQQTTSNINLVASYTLAFADGTGSDDRSQAALVDNGVPNLRTVMPLNSDVRHTLSGNFDFHFADDPSVPRIFGKRFLKNSGVNLIFRARSGEPYTREGTARDAASINPSGTKILSGTINGSRLPWNYKFDLKVDKDIAIKTGKKDQGKSSKFVYMNVYIIMTNLLNTKNIQSVYSYTGNPGDDGYIGSPTYNTKVANLNSVQGYVDQYLIRANNPDNYSIPRRIRLGVSFNF